MYDIIESFQAIIIEGGGNFLLRVLNYDDLLNLDFYVCMIV